MREAEIDTWVNELQAFVWCERAYEGPYQWFWNLFQTEEHRNEVTHPEARIWLEMSRYYVLADQANQANLKHAKPLLLSQTFSIQYNDPHITNGDFCVYSW